MFYGEYVGDQLVCHIGRPISPSCRLGGLTLGARTSDSHVNVRAMPRSFRSRPCMIDRSAMRIEVGMKPFDLLLMTNMAHIHPIVRFERNSLAILVDL